MSPVYFVNKVPSTLKPTPGPQKRGTGGTPQHILQRSWRRSRPPEATMGFLMTAGFICVPTQENSMLRFVEGNRRSLRPLAVIAQYQGSNLSSVEENLQ